MARTNVYRVDEFDGKILDGWFDPATAETYDEDTRWDGNNHISLATNAQFYHEILYRTKGGRWVRHCWSQWQGSEASYEFVADDTAKNWLLRNNHDEAIEVHFGELEDERGPGRPEIGPAVNIRLPQNLLDQLDARAQADGVARAEMVRRFVTAGLTN